MWAWVRRTMSIAGKLVPCGRFGATLTAQQNQTLGKDGVDEHFFPVDLKQEGGVTDEGDAELIAANEFQGA